MTNDKCMCYGRVGVNLFFTLTKRKFHKIWNKSFIFCETLVPYIMKLLLHKGEIDMTQGVFQMLDLLIGIKTERVALTVWEHGEISHTICFDFCFGAKVFPPLALIRSKVFRYYQRKGWLKHRLWTMKIGSPWNRYIRLGWEVREESIFSLSQLSQTVSLILILLRRILRTFEIHRRNLCKFN